MCLCKSRHQRHLGIIILFQECTFYSQYVKALFKVRCQYHSSQHNSFHLLTWKTHSYFYLVLLVIETHSRNLTNVDFLKFHFFLNIEVSHFFNLKEMTKNDLTNVANEEMETYSVFLSVATQSKQRHFNIFQINRQNAPFCHCLPTITVF